VLPQEIIRTKRDGGEVPAVELERFVAGLVDGAVTEGQAAAFAMAVFFNGMALDERVALTRAMTSSGAVLSWADLDGAVVDKHSTGGVGDTVSLLLAPAVAACGAFVPMISGRGLGHTGGTFDKMASIPGYDAAPERDRFRRVVREVGCAIIGQTDDLAPADKRLYAIRDVTATVDCLPLIVASILAKKLAAGLEALVLDIKRGNGAVLPEPERGRELARAMGSTAAEGGLAFSALLTDMSEPLARSAGNALEVAEAAALLRGEGADPRLLEVTLALGAEVMRLAKLAPDERAARARLSDSLANGSAAERFARMVASLGGPADFLERPEAYLARAPIVRDVPASTEGTITAIDTRAVGFAVIALGGGRTSHEQDIDPAVGFDRLLPRGAKVERGDPIARVHAADAARAEAAARALQRAFTIGDGEPQAPALVERIG
jgi:thymidine phosphorylase